MGLKKATKDIAISSEEFLQEGSILEPLGAEKLLTGTEKMYQLYRVVQVPEIMPSTGVVRLEVGEEIIFMVGSDRYKALADYEDQL